MQFIGRRDQLNTVQEHIYHCLSGQPRVLLIEGLAGIGKTRFLEEITVIAGQQGMDVYTGTCDEIMREPCAPFVGLVEAPSVQTSTPHEFLMRTSDTLVQTAEQQPLLLIVDDLHAADQSSLDLFEYLAVDLTEQRTTPVLLVGSHRPVAPDHTLSRLHGKIYRLTLPGLEESETRELLQSLGVTRPTQQLVHTIYQATHGIPLFIQEAVHHAERVGALYTRGGYLAVRPNAVATLQIPEDISSTITERIDALPADCQDVLSLASLLGDSFSADRLEFLAEEVSTEAAHETAVQHGILRRDDERYHFTHSLIRQALTERLSIRERQRLHLRIAGGMDESQTLEIAHHLIQAGPFADPYILGMYAQQAGDKAFAQFAWSEAARYYEAALNVTELDADRAIMHYQAGSSHFYNQDAGPALEHFDQARALYETLRDIEGLACSLIYIVRLRLMHATVPIGVLPPHAKELEIAADSVDPMLRGHSLAVLSQAYRHARQAETGVRLAQDAFEIGRNFNDDSLCALAGQSLSLAHLSLLEVEPTVASWQKALRHGQAAGDPVFQMFPLTNLPLVMNLQGSLEEGEAKALEGVEMAKRVQDWGECSKAFSHLASISAAKGQFTHATQYARDTMTMVERSGYPWGGFRALGALACASALRGLWDEAYEALDILITPGRVFEDPGRVIPVYARVFRQLTLGYHRMSLTERIAPLHDELMEVVTYDTYSLAPLCAMIELGDLTLMPQFAERPAEMLTRAMAQGVVFTSGWSFLIPRSLGLAAMMLEDWDQAEEHFQHAIAIATYNNALPELGRACLDYAQLLCFDGDFEAKRYLEQARWIFYERSMIPHARYASETLETQFPDDDDNDDDDNRESPYRNGTS